MKKSRVYLAGPFFNDEQLERIEYIEELLDDLGYDVYSPRKDCSFQLTAESSLEERDAVFQDNIRNIEYCNMIIVVTDGKDMGTIFEAGYAYKCEKPILYFAETLGDGKFNLMLAQSGMLGYCLTRHDLKERLEILSAMYEIEMKKQEREIFDGHIE